MAKISKIEIDGLPYDLQDLETSEKLENEITRATEIEQDLLDKWDGLINSPESIIPIKTVNGEDLIGTGNIEIIGERGEKGDKGEKGEQGEPGITSATVSVDNTIGTPSATATITGQVLDIKFKGLKGEQGNSGYTGAVDELEIVNNLTQGGATSALSAEMGKELTGRVDNLENTVYGIKEVSDIIITQNDFKEEDVNIIHNNTRGVIYWSVADLSLFESATLTVKSGVNLKVSMHSTNSPLDWGSIISDTGWITAGNTKTIDKSFVEGESYLRLAWTNSEGTAAVPSLETLVSSIEFTLEAQQDVYNFGLTNQVNDISTIVSDLSETTATLREDIKNYVIRKKALELTTIQGYGLNSSLGVFSNASFELIDYVDISEETTKTLKAGLWISDDVGYDSVVELYDSSKVRTKKYYARELYGSVPSKGEYIVEAEIDVTNAYYIRFNNIISTKGNTNADFAPIKAELFTFGTPIPSSQVVDESLNKTQDEINAEIGSLQSTIFGTTSVGATDTITQENITEDTYTSTTAGSGRGMFVFPISQYDTYTFSVSVAADSTIKACIHLKNSKGWSDNFYDGGWIVAGKSQSITNAQDKRREAPFAGLGFTYISTNTGIPTIEEIQQYVTIEFVGSIIADKGLVGKVDNLEKQVFPSAVGYSYQGEKVSFVDNGFTSEIIGNLSAGVSSRQGGAIYGDYLFQFHNTLQTIVVYNLKSGKNVQTLNLTPISNHHAGSGGFSNEFYDSTDQFPILYISSMYENRIYGYRISGTEEGNWTIETVRTITLDIEGLFIPNITVDRENNMIVAFGYTKNSWSDSSNNLSVITSFVLPALSSGDVTITTSDCSDMRKIPFIYAEQGAFARLGKLYLSYGNTVSKCGMFVIDYIAGIAVSHAPFEPLGNFEPEAFALYNGNIIMTDQNGRIYKLTF